MKIAKRKGFIKTIIALVIAMVLAMQPLTALANGNTADESEMRMAYLTEAARDIVLADFDYLVEVILQNLPTQGVFARRFGVTLEDILADVRAEIIMPMVMLPAWGSVFLGDAWQDAPTDDLAIAADYLYALLIEVFGGLFGGFAHMLPVTQTEYERIATSFLVLQYAVESGAYSGQASTGVAQMQAYIDMFLTPEALWFYNFNPEDIDASDFSLLEAVLPAIDGNITTTSIEAGTIAYLRIGSWLSNPLLDSEILFPFFESIQDYQHLIIDVRGNSGGLPHYVTDFVIGMLIDEPLDFVFTEFIAGGAYALAVIEDHLDSSISFGATAQGLVPAADFIAANGLGLFELSDLAYMEYVVEWKLRVNPAVNNTPFAGEIWVLTDFYSASASEFFAHIAINTGFATVVGEPTMGVTGASTIYVVLPQTGILFRVDVASLVDAQGRALE